ncbi:MAG: 4Fe-4S binding protein [Coriobacteriia bacterium]|nr:4Fe-4S binding protein [Coriobacteriia bacterium]
MAIFKLGTMTLKSVFKKPETLKYPYETKEPYEKQKGFVKQIDDTKCNLCGICSKKCPCGAINVDRDAKVWEINHFKCIQCQYCIMSCPKKSLEMDGHKPEISTEKKIEKIEINNG